MCTTCHYTPSHNTSLQTTIYNTQPQHNTISFTATYLNTILYILMHYQVWAMINHTITYQTIPHHTIHNTQYQYNTTPIYNIILIHDLMYTALQLYATPPHSILTLKYKATLYNTTSYTGVLQYTIPSNTLHYTISHYTTLHLHILQYNYHHHNTIQYMLAPPNQYNTTQPITQHYNNMWHNITRNNTSSHNPTQQHTTHINT